VAFKEWSGVCSALIGGRQSLILRKGGIDEGPGGFRPEHPAFWLYPTRVHQAQQGLKPGASEDDAASDPHSVVLQGLAVVTRVDHVGEAGRLEALDDLHVWTAETVEKRFHYRKPGLWVLTVRVYIASPHTLSVTPEQLGCKTWVPLGDGLPTAGAMPALDDATFAREEGRIALALGSGERS
jgi:hypothetical protein